MNILAQLFGKSPTDSASDGLEQTEREAILDLLLYCTYTDNHLSLAEDRILKSEVDAFTWDSGTDVGIYLNNATDRARRADESSEYRNEFLSHIKDRLKSDQAIDRAISSMEALFKSDGEADEEKVFASEISRLLQGE